MTAMIKDALEKNENVTPANFNLGRLQAACPEFFDSAGAFKFDDFKSAMTNEDVDFSHESFKLDFVGRSYAEYVAGLETETVIVPDTDHNNSPGNKDSENIYIIGDNLDALKHLRKSYKNSIKCIYIDPPYNTGKDGFVYNDSFGYTKEDLVKKVGLTEEEAERTIALNGKSTHSAWLSFMLPRLKIARTLLADDGIIYVSIDEHEASNLSNLSDEIFGESNRLGLLPVVMNLKGNQDRFAFADTHEYFIVFAKQVDSLDINQFPIEEEDLAKGWLEDDYGMYKEADNLRATGVNAPRHMRSNLWYPIFVNPESGVFYTSSNDEKRSKSDVAVYPVNPDGDELSWYWKKSKVNDESYNLILKNTSNGWQFYKKQRPALGNLPTSKPKSFFYKASYSTSTATKRLEELMENEKVFTGPKPVPFIRDLVMLGTKQDSIILDFFSGSGTTAEAVMKLNSEDKGSRKYILVQLPEMIAEDSKSSATRNAYRLGYRTIDEIGRDRITRAAARIKEETGADIDYGFKLFRLEKPQVADLESLEKFDPADGLFDVIKDYVSRMSSGNASGEDIILTTLMNRFHKTLTPGVERVPLDAYSLPVVGKDAFVVSEGLTNDDVHELVSLIENAKLTLNRVIVLHYSVGFHVMKTLKSGLQNMKNSRDVELVEVF